MAVGLWACFVLSDLIILSIVSSCVKVDEEDKKVEVKKEVKKGKGGGKKQPLTKTTKATWLTR